MYRNSEVTLYSISSVPQWKTYYQLLDQYDLSETLKMHIICDHYEDYFELTGESLHLVTDEVTESVHFHFRIFQRDTWICLIRGRITESCQQGTQINRTINTLNNQ